MIHRRSFFAAIVLRTIRASLAATAAGLLMLTPCLAYTDAEYEDAIQMLRSASSGDNSAISKALEKFSALSQVEPGDPLLLVNVGAATSLHSRTTILPWKKISYAEDGMAIQDKALEMLKPDHDSALHNGSPVSLQVRLVAASTFLSVPRFFNREALGGRILNDLMASPLFPVASLQFKGSAWMRAARWAVDENRPEDARRYWGMVIENNAPQAEEAKVKLDALK